MRIFETSSGSIFSVDSLSPRFKSFPEIKTVDYTESAVKEIEDLRDIPAGWDYGTGLVVEETVIQKALQVYESTYQVGFSVKVFPRSDGGITLSYSLHRGISWYYPGADNFLDVVINPDTTLSLVQERGIGENYEIVHEEENADLDCVKTLLNSILSVEWPLLELYTGSGTTQISNVSRVIVFPHSKEEYPFSMPIAPYSNQEQYVNTYEDSTNQQLVVQ